MKWEPVALMALLILLGAFTKSAQLPFHVWLPSDIMAVIRPSWLTVPHASTSLASAWRRAPIAPQNIVSRPTVTPRPDQMSTAPSTGCITPIKTMPAFTMVAECR